MDLYSFVYRGVLADEAVKRVLAVESENDGHVQTRFEGLEPRAERTTVVLKMLVHGELLKSK